MLRNIHTSSTGTGSGTYQASEARFDGQIRTNWGTDSRMILSVSFSWFRLRIYSRLRGMKRNKSRIEQGFHHVSAMWIGLSLPRVARELLPSSS
jgi:hypothetical protein